MLEKNNGETAAIVFKTTSTMSITWQKRHFTCSNHKGKEELKQKSLEVCRHMYFKQ